MLNIGAGGGREVLNALNHGSTDITAVDVSRATVDKLMKGELAEFSGRLYERPGVTAVADEGRSFVERSGRTYDLLDFTIVGGTNIEKLDVMKVEDLFTVEALTSYLTHLAPDGVFSYVMYNTGSDLVSAAARQPFVANLPYIPALKTLTGLRLVLEKMKPGAKFEDHVLIAGLHGVMARGYDLVHIFVSMSPFTAEERARFERRVSELGFVPFYPKGAGVPNLYDDIVRAPDLAAFERTLPFNIQPATDDRPFHYAFAWHAVPSAAALAALLWNNPITSTGLAFGGIAALFLFGPVLVWRNREPVAARAVRIAPLLVYFACIGAGLHDDRDGGAPEAAALPRQADVLAVRRPVLVPAGERHRQRADQPLAPPAAAAGGRVRRRGDRRVRRRVQRDLARGVRAHDPVRRRRADRDRRRS